MDSNQQLTLCCLLWAADGEEQAMSRYEDEVLAFIPDHGGEVLHRVIGDGANGHPHEVQVLRFPGQAAVDGFLVDSRRTALADIRDRTIAKTDLFPVRLA